ncbi:MAG TPA: hypothetical protein VD710_09500 [Nitrososphaeraceae archaeon]|nr:hypothetical protein [Nitrososphaeraceae archaeon]
MISYRKDDCLKDSASGNGSMSYFGSNGSITVVSTIIGNAGRKIKNYIMIIYKEARFVECCCYY